MRVFLTCKCCCQISELWHTFKGLIDYLYIVILYYVLLTRYKHSQFSHFSSLLPYFNMQMVSSWRTQKWSEEFHIYTSGLSASFHFSTHAYQPNVSDVLAIMLNTMIWIYLTVLFLQFRLIVLFIASRQLHLPHHVSTIYTVFPKPFSTLSCRSVFVTICFPYNVLVDTLRLLDI